VRRRNRQTLEEGKQLLQHTHIRDLPNEKQGFQLYGSIRGEMESIEGLIVRLGFVLVESRILLLAHILFRKSPNGRHSVHLLAIQVNREVDKVGVLLDDVLDGDSIRELLACVFQLHDNLCTAIHSSCWQNLIVAITAREGETVEVNAEKKHTLNRTQLQTLTPNPTGTAAVTKVYEPRAAPLLTLRCAKQRSPPAQGLQSGSRQTPRLRP
jgi:hypothetical protein